MNLSFTDVAEQEREIVRIARCILDQSVGIIAGSREMVSVPFQVHSDDLDQEFLCFHRIASETDHLPLSDARRHWGEEALAAKDAEIRAAEDWFRERAFEAARILVQRYGITEGKKEGGRSRCRSLGWNRLLNFVTFGLAGKR